MNTKQKTPKILTLLHIDESIDTVSHRVGADDGLAVSHFLPPPALRPVGILRPCWSVCQVSSCQQSWCGWPLLRKWPMSQQSQTASSGGPLALHCTNWVLTPQQAQWDHYSSLSNWKFIQHCSKQCFCFNQWSLHRVTARTPCVGIAAACGQQRTCSRLHAKAEPMHTEEIQSYLYLNCSAIADDEPPLREKSPHVVHS